MEYLGYPAAAVQRARRLLLAAGIALGSMSCLAAILAVLSENPIMIVVSASLAALIFLGLGLVWLARVYRSIPAVQEKHTVAQRLAAVSQELQVAKRSGQFERLTAIQHRKERIQGQLVQYQALNFASFLRIAANWQNKKFFRASVIFASVWVLAACCLVGYSLLPGRSRRANAPSAVSQEIGLAVSPSAVSTRQLATPTSSVTATQLPTHTATVTPTSAPTATSTISPSPVPVIAGGACLPAGAPQEAEVLRVLDGDTIEVRLVEDQQVYRVRYIGIDSPESGAPFAAEAAAANARMVTGQKLLLYRDVSEVDRYGRLLRYVVAGEVFVNAELTHLGLATAVNYPPDEACASVFQQAQADAQAVQVGWYAPGAVNPFDPVVVAPAAGEVGSRGGCSPAYPDICLPPPPPDLDCADVSARRFRVLPPDPHHFDGDGDGIGCES